MRIGERSIPSLDGLRAFSILLVVSGHLIGTRHFPWNSSDAWIGEMSHLGVQVFFVISGFLITSLLLREDESTGRISLWGFYRRRFLRILPAFSAFMVCLLISVWLNWTDVRQTDFMRAATFTVNYYSTPNWNVGHLWSLSTEEQFYLIWPAALILIGRTGWRALAIFALAAPLVRIAIAHIIPGFILQFPNGMDTIAAGCLLALYRARLWSMPGYRAFVTSRLVYLVLLIPLVHVATLDYPRAAFFSGILIGPSLAILIDGLVRAPHGFVGRTLNLPTVRFVGVLSYSLYLWQQPFLNRQSSAWPATFPVNLILAFAFATLSFYLIETPALRYSRRLQGKRGWKADLTTVPATGTPDGNFPAL